MCDSIVQGKFLILILRLNKITLKTPEGTRKQMIK